MPPPCGRPDAEPAAERLDAVGETAQTRTALAVGAADAVVDDLDDSPLSSGRPSTRRRRRLRVLADVGEALGHDVVRGHLERLGQAPVDLDREPNRHRRPGGELLERDRQPVTREHGRMEPARDGAQLLERHRDLALRLVQSLPRIGVVAQLLLEHAQLEREGDQPLLRAVVQVALQPLPLPLPGLDHTCARALQLLEMRLLLGLQAPVLQRDAGRRADRSEQLGLVLQRAVVHKRRDVRTVAIDQRRRPPVLRAALDRPSVEIGLAPNSGSQ